MPQHGTKANNKFSNGQKQKKKDLVDEEFDVVESDPDQVTDSESENDENPNTDPRRRSLKVPRKSLAEGSDEMKERLRKLSCIQLTWKDYVSTLDFYMLGLFFKGMFLFFFIGFLLFLLSMVVIYYCNKDLWYEYFPVDDDEEEFLVFRDEF